MSGLEDLLGGASSSSNIINSLIPRETGFYMVVSILFVVGLIAAAYAFDGFMVRNIGRKAGLEKDWMAFVPFARTLYRLQMINEQWWKMFFLEYWLLYFWIIRWFFNLFDNRTMTTFGNVLAVLFVCCQIAYRIYYRNKFYRAFGLKNELALGIVTIWGVGFLTRTVDCLIAFTNLIEYGEAKESRRIGEILGQQARPNVPHGASPSCGLSGLSGMYAGQNIPMAPNDDLIIGRDSSFANVIIDQNADKISRKHCVVRFDSARNSYMVTDYSTNGTFIDGGSRLVANVPTPMQRGTVIALGSRENRFKLN